MNNNDMLVVLKKSFVKYLSTSSRSNEKLKILHGSIAKDLEMRLNDRSYEIISLGWGNGNEEEINGRYIDKKVDITVKHDGKPIAGFAVKFVMSNYSQNSNNYFENMLGETANIRCANVPYFQIFIIPDKVPYFKKTGEISKWDVISKHNLQKYICLSFDKVDAYMHTPNKTLIYIVHISGDNLFKTKDEYEKYFLNNNFDISLSKTPYTFGSNIVYNNYEEFATKCIYYIKSL